jgi:hypothetical protein
MNERSITYLSDAFLITCVLQKELAEDVLAAAKNIGAQGATISYARGTGIRERMGLLGVTIDEQKEVMYLAGKLDTPGMGIMYMVKLDRVATYVPDAILNAAK